MRCDTGSMAGPSGYLDMDMVVTQRGDLLETRVLDSPAGETGTVAALVPLAGSGDDGDVGDALFAASDLTIYRHTEFLSPANRSLTVVHPKLVVNVFGVGAKGVERDDQLAGNFGAA